MKLLVTGARGFIGSNLVKALNVEGYFDLLLADEIENVTKDQNLNDMHYDLLVDRILLFEALDGFTPEFVFHLGARTDTTEMDASILDELNFEYSKQLWHYCVEKQIPFLYASSAATYGDGAEGFDDRKPIDNLQPLNPYGWSKQKFDLWVQTQKKQPPFWCGLKFFNVYGPGENHKQRMASVVYHAFHQIKKDGHLKLFKSHKPAYQDGEQRRDFIYVKDIVSICLYFFRNQRNNGIYNCGSGQARSFNDLAKAVFKAMNVPVSIDYIDIPEDIRDRYQYFTEATMDKMKQVGYTKPFYTLEAGVQEYVEKYLLTS